MAKQCDMCQNKTITDYLPTGWWENESGTKIVCNRCLPDEYQKAVIALNEARITMTRAMGNMEDLLEDLKESV